MMPADGKITATDRKGRSAHPTGSLIEEYSSFPARLDVNLTDVFAREIGIAEL